MPLTDEDLASLFLPGTISLPSPFPTVGDVELEEPREPGTLVIVRRRVWPSTKVCWSIRVEHVSAILLTKDHSLDPETATWLFGPSAPERLKALAKGKPLKGIVFVPESAPVMMGLEFGKTASEAAEYAIPGLPGGGCDPCCHHAFSYERVMGKPDK